MSRRTTSQAEVQDTVQASEVVNAAEQQQVVNDVFAQFMSEDDGSERSREDIIKELIASGNAKRLNNLTVKNVVATEFDTHALLTFVVKEFVIGDTRDANEVDAFGQPVVKLGKTHNVQTSSYAVAGVMKILPSLLSLQLMLLTLRKLLTCFLLALRLMSLCSLLLLAKNTSILLPAIQSLYV